MLAVEELECGSLDPLGKGTDTFGASAAPTPPYNIYGKSVLLRPQSETFVDEITRDRGLSQNLSHILASSMVSEA